MFYLHSFILSQYKFVFSLCINIFFNIFNLDWYIFVCMCEYVSVCFCVCYAYAYVVLSIYLILHLPVFLLICTFLVYWAIHTSINLLFIWSLPFTNFVLFLICICLFVLWLNKFES